MSKQIFALLVGINEYPKFSGVNHLRGCVNDVKAVKSFLEEFYPHRLQDAETQIKCLTNEKATRKAIIENFQDHLGQAELGDIILFYYSGHGSYEHTSEVFESYDSKNQNETLVCYDSRLEGGFDLADKELAVLLHQLPAQTQKVVILDSCHSGSATRSMEESFLEARRQEPPKRKDGEVFKRPLATYFLSEDNYYTIQQPGKVSIPQTEHLLIAACDRDETALETSIIDENKERKRCGLFTSSLLKALRKNQAKITYHALYNEVRTVVNEHRKFQTPKVEPINGFNAQQQFLSDHIVNTRFNEMRWIGSKQEWQLDFGAVHGLSNDPNVLQKIKVALFAEDNTTISIGEGTIKAVKMDHTVVQYPKPQDGQAILLKAALQNLPQVQQMWVYLDFQEAEQQAHFERIAKITASHFLYFTNVPAGTKYRITFEENELRIYQNGTNKLIQGAVGMEDWGIREMLKILVHLEKYERISGLSKRAAYLAEKDIEFQFSIGQAPEILPNDIQLVAAEIDELEDGSWSKVPFDLKLQNKGTEDLYALLIVLNRKFGVIKTVTKILKSGADLTEMLKSRLTIKDKEETESEMIFKIIISTEELIPTYFQLAQIQVGKIWQFDEGIFKDLDEEEGQAPKEADWFTKTYRVITRRNLTTIGHADKEVNGLQFIPNSSVSGKIAFNAVSLNQKSVHPLSGLKDYLEGAEIEVINFSNTRGTAEKSIISISDIQGEFETEPLQINLDNLLNDGEKIIPVTHDGEFIIPFGKVEKTEQGNTIFSIDSLPPQADDGRKNVKRAIKFSLLKTYAKEPEIFQMRWVDFASQNSELRTKENLAEKVAGANKILLLIHGIIGDTIVMAKEAQFAVEEKGYDLVLTFDYENLATNIDKIGEALEKSLREEAKITLADQKEITIVAHSMGGLVSRYMIENILEDNGLISKLILFGTPNGGSRFGHLPKAKSFFNYALGYALNFLPPQVKPFVDGAKKVWEFIPEDKKPEFLTTLEMMAVGSDFIKKLAENPLPQKTAYYIVAGNIEAYQVAKNEGNWFSRFTERMTLVVGKVVNFGHPNDIAVKVDDIFRVNNVPADCKKEVVGHHLNYFVNPESVAIWKEWV